MGVYLKRPVLVCLFVRRVGSFSYTPHGQICQVSSFVGWGVTFTRPYAGMTRHLVSVEFLLHTRCWNQSGRFMNVVSLLHAPVLICV